MDGIEQRLEAILSNPESMGKIMELAKGLGLEPSNTQEEVTQTSTVPMSNMLGNIAPLLSASNQQGLDGRQTALLNALRPYLRPERQDRLNKAIQAAKLVKTAKLALGQFNLRGDANV